MNRRDVRHNCWIFSADQLAPDGNGAKLKRLILCNPFNFVTLKRLLPEPLQIPIPRLT